MKAWTFADGVHEFPPVMDEDPRDYFRLDPAFLREYEGKSPVWGPVDSDGRSTSPIGEVTFLRTYPAFLHDLNRLETPAEVFARCTETVMGVFARRVQLADGHWNAAKAQREGQELFRRMWALKILPGGRMLANLGRQSMLQKGAVCLNNCAFFSTREIGHDLARPFADVMDYLMLGAGVGFDTRGAAALTPVLTPERTPEVVQIQDTRESWCVAVARVFRAFRAEATLPVWGFDQLRRKGLPLRTFGGVSSGPGPLQALLRGLEELLEGYVGRVVNEALIVDAMNLIGRCVVAGGVRRSSEIALGARTDAFMALKDPAQLTALTAKLDARAAVCAAGWEGAAELARLRAEMPALDVLGAEFAQAQDAVDALEAQRDAILYADAEWAQLSAEINAHPLRAWRWASNNSVMSAVGDDYTRLSERIVTNGEPGLLWLDNVRRFGRMVDGDLTAARMVTADTIHGLRPDPAIGCNPCGEIPLEDGELCCLVETFPTRHTDAEDWIASLKYAYMIGKAVTDLPTHNARTSAVIARNRRIGVSITGIAGWYVRLGRDAMNRALDRGYRELRRLDALYSGWLGVPESIRLTTVKPSGTLSLLAGVEGGMRFPEAPYCIRIVRLHDTSPLIDRLRDAGYRVEPDRYAPHTVCVHFPVRDTAVGRPITDVSLWEQAQIQADVQGWWADNMVSATLMVRAEDGPAVPRVLAAFDARFKGCSMLPYATGVYAQPPYTPVPERRYREELARTRPVDLTNLGMARDSEERFCDGGACALPG